MQKQQGFTLIELMIVVAIIGILAAIAIPQYQSYVTRSKMTEVVTAASACRTSVAEFYSTTGKLPTTENQAGCEDQSSDYVESVKYVVDSNQIQAAIKGIDSTVNTGYVALTANKPSGSGSLTWDCSGSTDAVTQVLPANCRGS